MAAGRPRHGDAAHLLAEQFHVPSTDGDAGNVGPAHRWTRSGPRWLNGHNLGESPQKVPMYVPECWLKDGPNDLVIFDLHGARPEQVKFSRYEVFAVADAK